MIMVNPQIQKFKLIHEGLTNLINSQDIDQELLQSKIMKYIAVLAQQGLPHHQEHPFDYFCQHNGLTLMTRLLKIHSLIAIKAYSLLFINLKNQIWTNFMLCQPFVTDAIQTKCDAYEQEWTQYYISLLKSLSIRIGDTQISVFYNKKSCTFPIVFQAMKYFNHPDFMVRTSVMNIILEMMKIKQEKTKEYFSRFPFTSYLITFCCQVYSLIKKFNQKITHQLENAQPSSKLLQNYSVDLSDYLYYFNDLITSATPTTTHIIRNCFFKYITVPLLRLLASQNKTQAKHSILILTDCIKIIKDKYILQTLILLLLRPRIPKQLLEDIMNKEEAYLPEVYTQQFDPNNFYWSKYKNDIVGHCLKVFDDIEHFSVEYEESQQKSAPQFVSQVNKMSQSINYDLLKNESNKEFDNNITSLFEPSQEKAQFVYNPFRQHLLTHMKKQQDDMLVLILELIIKIFQNKNVSKMTFVLSEIQRLSIQLKYIEECQIHLSQFEKEIKGIITQRLLSINWKNSTIKQLEIMIRMLRILNDQPFVKVIEERFYKKYKEIAELLKTFVVKQNINQLVQNFQTQYYLIQNKMIAGSLDYDTPFAVALLPLQQLADKNQDISLPITERKYILHHIKQFWYMRNIILFYFENFYDMQYFDFTSEYQKYFGEKRWHLGKKYKIIRTKTISCDFIQKSMKKPQKVIIVQDPQTFLVAQLQPEGVDYKIIVSVNWIKISFEMNRQQCTNLQAKITTTNIIDKFNLIFDDQIRSSKVLANFNDLKWQRYQKELSFIYRFIEHVIHKQ